MAHEIGNNRTSREDVSCFPKCKLSVLHPHVLWSLDALSQTLGVFECCVVCIAKRLLLQHILNAPVTSLILVKTQL